MARVSTTKIISPNQLLEELGIGQIDLYGIVYDQAGEKEIEADVSESVLTNAIAAHIPDPEYGKSAERREFKNWRTKAQNVIAGTDTFTAIQIQRLVAGMVLELTRPNE